MSQSASELFIVDNSDSDWKVRSYLSDWCDLSSAIDIATGYFEIGALLSLKEQWRKVDRIRILMGKETAVPDFVFHIQRTVVFVDGCFWHSCPKHSNLPANNRPFWEKKLNGNKARDRFVNRCLRKAGWQVVRIWEHNLAKRPDVCIRRIQRVLQIG